ncbi:MAG: hypothetical protein APF76_11285 [Desulfitibacter sp. BRH_c19]|nr:MAG: hypothetical protein APF76_11285 [Desulfitibacter sp. BRH_c19]
MPTITYDGPALPLENKRTAAKEITDTISKATKLDPSNIVVIFKENAPENVAVGGKLIVDRKKA